MKNWLEAPGVHAALVVAVSIGFESLFVHHSLNLLDEGWPLYAAMGLHEGGSLYREVFWVFPPGHLLPAWIAYAIDPPGVVLARVLYAGLTASLCVALLFLGRRLLPAGWALFGALLLAVAAASAHRYQALFGYRYLVFAVLALLCFARRIETGDRRLTALAGVLTGVALVFRLTPAFAVAVGIAAGVASLSRSPREALREGLFFGAGLLAVAGPVIAWLAADVGPAVLWREVVVRPVRMTELQSLPMPPLDWRPKHATRRSIMSWGAAWQFRLYLVLYGIYAGALLLRGWRAFRAGRPFESPLLLAFVVFGGVYFVRTLGRSDAPHLYSALPPVCLLLAHALAKASAWRPGEGRLRARPSRVQAGVAAVAGALWLLFMGGDVFLFAENRGQVPVRSLDGRVGVNSEQYAGLVDRIVEIVRRSSAEGERVLDLSASPLLLVIAGRLGPGGPDLVMPGTFLDESEELAFVARLEASPPALVLWPNRPFDELPGRAVTRTAPHVVRWVRDRYQPGPRLRFGKGRRPPVRYTILLPKPDPAHSR